MALKRFMLLRRIFFSTTMLGFFIWHSDWLPTSMTEMLNYILPVTAILAVLNEVLCTAYLFRAFDNVKGEVIAQEDTQDDNISVKNYQIKFEYKGMMYAFPHRESILSRSIEGRPLVNVLVDKNATGMVMIDSFKLKYMYVILAVFIGWTVYTGYHISG